jgi:hypothetical protein
VPGPNLSLTLSAADALLTAWSQAKADDMGVRQLVIKGRTLAHHGLRAPRVSSDVDVLVDPQRFDDYCAAVMQAGWAEIPETFVTKFFTLHSRTFTRSGWPNTLDVHRYFPGFLNEPGTVFEELWKRRETLPIAQHDCFIVDKSSSILILALHSLRSSRRSQRPGDELEGLTRSKFDPAVLDDIVDLAHATGSAAPLRATFAAMGIDVRVDPSVASSPEYRDWVQLVAAADGSPADWGSVLRRAPWGQKGRVLFRALWPGRVDLERAHPEAAGSRMALLRVRLSRLRRGSRWFLVGAASQRDARRSGG